PRDVPSELHGGDVPWRACEKPCLRDRSSLTYSCGTTWFPSMTYGRWVTVRTMVGATVRATARAMVTAGVQARVPAGARAGAGAWARTGVGTCGTSARSPQFRGLDACDREA